MQASQKDDQNSQDLSNSNKEVPLKLLSPQNPRRKPPLSPFLVKTLECGSSYGRFASYSERYNMISVWDSSIEFYNGTTLEPRRRRLEPRGSVTSMDYCDQTKTFIFLADSCTKSYIYIYNTSRKELEMHEMLDDEWWRNVAFLDSKFFVCGFDGDYSRELMIGRLEKGAIEWVGSMSTQGSGCVALEAPPGRNLLLSSFKNGLMVIHNTKNPHYLRRLFSFKPCPDAGQWVVALKMIDFNGKEFILTSGKDRTLKIWHFVKGRMGLLRAIHTEGVVESFVYLNKWKMIAAVSESSNEIKFWGLFSGRLERTFVCEKNKVVYSLFLKQRNTLGAVGQDCIELIHLQHPLGKQL